MLLIIKLAMASTKSNKKDKKQIALTQISSISIAGGRKLNLPLKEYLKWMKRGGRPFFEGVIIDDLFSFIRNLLLHFPIFDTWDEVYINKSLATWDKAGRINKFLTKAKEYKIDDKSEVKYRIWEVKKKKMTYFSVKFPSEYNEITNIYLKDIITEEMGMKFCMALMRQIINTQIENPEENIKIMSQVYLPRNNNDL